MGSTGRGGTWALYLASSRDEEWATEVCSAHFFLTPHLHIYFIFKLVVFIPNCRWLKWHHLRQLIRFFLAPSGVTKGFIDVTCAVVLANTLRKISRVPLSGVLILLAVWSRFHLQSLVFCFCLVSTVLIFHTGWWWATLQVRLLLLAHCIEIIASCHRSLCSITDALTKQKAGFHTVESQFCHDGVDIYKSYGHLKAISSVLHSSSTVVK